MTLVKDINEFRTLPVRGLDRQLLWQFNQLFSNLLVSIEDLNIKPGDGLFPYVQPSVKKALENFLKDYGKLLTINNAYRSVVAQTVLYNNSGSNLVGEPGKSDHQNGASLDIQEWDLVKDLITQPKYGWEWTYGMRDEWHFDYKKDIQDIKDDTVKAFQTLWNKANPESEQLVVDGDIGENLSVSKTLKCINNSPAEGFPNVGYPRTLKLTEPIQEGKDIGELQLALRKAGIKLEKANQVFDPATDQAVKEFQRSHSLTIDGIVSAEGKTPQALKPYLG
jgi:hypothetical protein